MEFKGKVEDVVTREFTKKDGTVVSITSIAVKEQAGDYPQIGLFELSDKITTQVKVGDVVSVEFNLSARQANGAWYGSNRAWKVKKELDI